MRSGTLTGGAWLLAAAALGCGGGGDGGGSPDAAGLSGRIEADGSSTVFPVSEATLQAHARKHAIGRMLGRTRVFSADDVIKLYEVLPCPSDSSNAHGPLTGSSGVPSAAPL